VSRVSDNNVVENFDFQKLTRSDEITGDFDVRLGWSRITTRMIVANSDIDTRDPYSNEWKELTITNRAADGRVDVDIVREDPLVLVVRSKDPALVMRAAKYLAQYCGGKILNESEEVDSPGQ